MVKTVIGSAIGVSARLALAAPETVHVTYHVQPGKLDEFLGVLAQQYPAGRKAGIVLADPHVILSGKEEGGKPVVIEVLTWRDANDPDDVATKYPEILALWKQMNALVEKRAGKQGIDIDAMEIVSAPSAVGPKK
jgi:hypothetical protein